MSFFGGDEEARRTWIVSFADLLSLMLTFMVMLFAMTNVDKPAPPEGGVDTLAATLDWAGREIPTAAARSSVDRVRSPPGLDLDYLAEVLRTMLAEAPLLSSARIERHDNRLVVALPATLLFAPGAADVSMQARAALAGLAPTLRGIRNRFAIEGHADPEAVPSGGAYDSNWELSLARAVAIAEVIAATGLDRPVICYGLADSRYDELGEIAESQRRAVARRVDLVFYASAEDER